MSKELKYNDGQKLVIEAVVKHRHINAHAYQEFPYELVLGDTSSDIIKESELDLITVNQPQPTTQQSQGIDRAQMVCLLLAPLSKDGCYTKDSIFEAIQAVDIIISELNKKTE